MVEVFVLFYFFHIYFDVLLGLVPWLSAQKHTDRSSDGRRATAAVVAQHESKPQRNAHSTLAVIFWLMFGLDSKNIRNKTMDKALWLAVIYTNPFMLQIWITIKIAPNSDWAAYQSMTYASGFDLFFLFPPPIDWNQKWASLCIFYFEYLLKANKNWSGTFSMPFFATWIVCIGLLDQIELDEFRWNELSRQRIFVISLEQESELSGQYQTDLCLNGLNLDVPGIGRAVDDVDSTLERRFRLTAEWVNWINGRAVTIRHFAVTIKKGLLKSERKTQLHHKYE